MDGADLVTVLAASPQLKWLPDPLVLAPLAVLVAIYVRRFRRARREAGGRGAGWPQALAFAAGMLALVAALASPVDALGEEYLFSAHMVQHVLLGDIAPALLLLSLSRVILRPATRRLMWVERALGPFASPWTGIAIWLVIMYAWHIPAAYDAALENPLIHVLEHAAFFTAGLMVWWPLIQPVPMRRRLTGLHTVAYIGTAKFGLAALGLYLTWSGTVLYDYYESVPRVWGLTAIGDQNTGGAIMMVEQSLTFVIALVVLFSRMLIQSEIDQKRRERLEDSARDQAGAAAP
ncbi:MAG TPA: cytochrome c oxidase assembly protein [Thermoleophilaceae bacterium]|nr:cytochrome c oxidase assembly protein [Thermoleophilaceae bacterium]